MAHPVAVKQADGTYKKVMVDDDENSKSSTAAPAAAPAKTDDTSKSNNRKVTGSISEGHALDELDKPDDGAHSSDQASNAGRQAQSTDHMNQY
jgi:hypothetical protein